MKEDYPIEIAEFAITRGVDKLPAFAWWIHHIMKKRDHIIASVKMRMKNITHKYGIEVPTSIEHAKKLDKQNNNTLWMDALKKEMANVGVAFEILEEE